MARKSRHKGTNNNFLLQVLKIFLYIAFLPITLLYLLYKFTKKQLAENPEGVWYKQTWGIILVLIFFYPAGVYLLWKYGKFQKNGKQVTTVCFGILFLFSLAITSLKSQNVTKTVEYERKMQNEQLASETILEIETDFDEQNINRTIIVDEETVATSDTKQETETIIETSVESATEEPVAFDSETEEPTTEEIITEPVTEPPTVPATQPPALVAVSREYWINTDSGKFHYPNCRTIKNREEPHWQTYSGDRNDLIGQGYSPCGVCEP